MGIKMTFDSHDARTSNLPDDIAGPPQTAPWVGDDVEPTFERKVTSEELAEVQPSCT